MDFLAQNKDTEFKVTEIAEKTGIDIKNMGKYLKSLEEQQRIKIRTSQEGKVRTKFVSFTEKPKSKIQEPDQGPAAIEEKEPEPPKPKIRKEPKEPKAKITSDDLRIKIMQLLNSDKSKYAKILSKLPKSWGGNLVGGGGWSGPWMTLLDLLPEIL